MKYKNYIFCDNAGGSQVPKQVYNAFTEFLTNNYVQPYGNNILSQKITKSLEEIHYITNTILNNQKGQIAYGSSCSQLVYNLAHAIGDELIAEKNNEIILTDFSHEACVSPFERLAIKNDLKLHWWSLKNSKSNKYEINSNDLLSKVNENTKLVVLPHVSNILGNVIDVKELTKSIKEINNDTKVLVDGVAYLPHGIVDVDDYGVDYYVVSFYKFCALRVSALYVKDPLSIKNQYHYFFDNEESIKKIEIGGANYESASSILGLRDYFMDLAKNYKYDYKIFNRELVEFVMTKINNYEASLTDLFKNCIEDNDEIEIIECKESIKVPIFALRFKNYNENNVNLILNELGIICKNGTFYCDRLFDNLNVCKQRGVLRISLMHYNNLDECKSIVSALNLFKKIESSFRFTLDYKYKNLVSHKLSKSFDNLSIDKYYNIKRGRGFSLVKVDDLDKLVIVLKENNIKNIKLPVSAPFHCSLMKKATVTMNEELNKLSFNQGKNKLISNVTAKEISNTEELKDLLIKQIENRVRWRESIINMIDNDINHFIEIGPGKVLSGLVKRINREVKINTINNQGDIESLEI